MYELEFNQSFTGGKSVSISEGKQIYEEFLKVQVFSC